MNAAIWPVGTATAVCLVVAVCWLPPAGFWPRAFRAARRLLATLGRYLFWGCGCPECQKARRQARRSHPSARVITPRRLDLTEDEAEARRLAPLHNGTPLRRRRTTGPWMPAPLQQGEQG